ncbi:hypothetical protein AGMMS49957_05820 [Synergistales bacterium]|nr:hypothetical protein AGMMS49957_05820 [Synergistales bacterium]
MTCGPDQMMRELYRKCKASKTKLYVSLESRMACGFGVCLACTCDTKGEDGAPVRKRVCADGPVFSAEEVYEA